MSLLHRDPRPLSRDRDVGFRDDRLFLIACDDKYAPAQYFEFFAIPRVQILVDVTLDAKSAPRHVLKRLISRRNELTLEEDDECWLVIDTDHNLQPNHRGTFTETIREAAAERIHVALSFPCFELWLLLHHATEDEVLGVKQCDEVQALIRAKVGSYNKTRLRREHYPDGSAAQAALRAERLDATVSGGDIPHSATTRVYRLIRAIIDKSLPSQLPPELRR